MKFKNYRRTRVRAIKHGGFHMAAFKPGETKEVPEHMEETCLAAGLVPLEEVTDFEARVDREAEAIAAEEDARKAKEAEQAAEKAEMVRKAAEKAEQEAAAKRSEAAVKAAATRKANAEKKETK